MKNLKRVFNVNTIVIVGSILLTLVMFTLVKCCDEDTEDSSKGVEFEVIYPGSYFVAFTNYINGKTKIYVEEKENSYTFSEKELKGKINKFHILYFQAHKILGEKYPDEGDLIVNVYDEGELIDRLVIPKGEKEIKSDYYFGDIEQPK